MLEANEELQQLIRFLDLVEGAFPESTNPAKGVPTSTLAQMLHKEWKGVLGGVGGEGSVQGAVTLGLFLKTKYGMVIGGRVMSRKRHAGSNNLVITRIS
jgi:hypothetical protein